MKNNGVYKIIVLFSIILMFVCCSKKSQSSSYSATGDLDTEFDPGTGPDNTVYSISILPGGKILIAGSFTQVDGTTRNRIARLNSDGSLDTTFDPGTGANNHIYSMALDSDEKIIIGGEFTDYNGTARNYIARLNTDGTLDTGFDPGTGGFWVTAVDTQTDNKVIAGGYFTTFNAVARNRIVRLDTDGSVDTGFDRNCSISMW